MSVSTATSARMPSQSNSSEPARLVTPTTGQHTNSSRSAVSPESMWQPDRNSMSPTKRTQKWLEGPSPVNDKILHKVKASNITKSSQEKRKKRSSFWGLSLLASLFGRDKNAEPDDDLEGDTFVAADDPIPSIELDGETTLVEGDGDHEKDVNIGRPDYTLKDYRSDKYLNYNDPRIKEWTGEEDWFFRRLRNRGAEPLFDHTWTMDFPTFPDSLFTKDSNQVYFTHNGCSLYRAVRAFDRLCKAGSLVRGQITSGAIPEKPLFREITNFYKWTLADGKLNRKSFIPVTAIACARPKESTQSVVGRVTDQLHDLGRQHRDQWRHPDCHESDAEQIYTRPLPTLFGFVIKFTVVAIVTCDSSVPRKPIRTLHTSDWKAIGQDVWHALAIAIAFIKQRNYLMQLDTEGELGPEIVGNESDPDA